MSSESKNIVFLNRAYNDLDVQLPLIEAMAEDPLYNVRVVGFPCDGDLGNPQRHEATTYMRVKHNVHFQTVLDSGHAPLYLRALHKVESVLSEWRKQDLGKNVLIKFPLKLLHVTMLKVLRRIFQKDTPWLHNVVKGWAPDIIIMDEVYVQPGRSYMIDSVLPRLVAEYSTRVFMILTGQNIYYNPFPGGTARPAYQPKGASALFLPGSLDVKIYKNLCPDENLKLLGNLRMDSVWIEKLHRKVLKPPYYNSNKKTTILPRAGTPKVVFMLSKMNYGIEAQALKDTIKAVANIPGIGCAIKPHTRGMKFDFMAKRDIGHAAVVDDIPSALLIEWADIVLFTGSGIAFHALLRSKAAGFLSYCQKEKTIFDDAQACIAYQSIEQLVGDIIAFRDRSVTFMDINQAQTSRQWLARHVHNDDREGLTVKNYKEAIEAVR